MWQLSEAAQRGRPRATAANALIIFIRGSFVARTQQTADMALPLTVAEGGVGRGGRGREALLWEVQAIGATSPKKRK